MNPGSFPISDFRFKIPNSGFETEFNRKSRILDFRFQSTIVNVVVGSRVFNVVFIRRWILFGWLAQTARFVAGLDRFFCRREENPVLLLYALRFSAIETVIIDREFRCYILVVSL